MSAEPTARVRFRQYLRPLGIPQDVTIDVPAPVAATALRLVLSGCRLEAECVPDGLVSFTVERDDADGEVEVLAAELVPNGPGVREAVTRLLAAAAERL